MNNCNGSVWPLYDELRTACLNVLYYESRLRFVELLNNTLEISIAISASATVISAIDAWNYYYAKIIWEIFSVLTAIISVVKPFLKLQNKIKKFDKVIVGYKIIFHDLKQLKIIIEQDRKYNKKMQQKFKNIMNQEKKLIEENPETKECTRTKRKCEAKVKEMFPVNSFFDPEVRNHVEK